LPWVFAVLAIVCCGGNEREDRIRVGAGRERCEHGGLLARHAFDVAEELEIRSGTEPPSVSANDQGPHLGVSFGLAQRTVHLVQHDQIDGVEARWGIEN